MVRSVIRGLLLVSSLAVLTASCSATVPEAAPMPIDVVVLPSLTSEEAAWCRPMLQRVADIDAQFAGQEINGYGSYQQWLVNYILERGLVLNRDFDAESLETLPRSMWPADVQRAFSRYETGDFGERHEIWEDFMQSGTGVRLCSDAYAKATSG